MHPSSPFSTYLKRIDILLQTTVILAFSLLFTIVGIPTLIIVGLAFNLNHQAAVISAKLFKGQLVKPLSPISAIMANVDHIYTTPYNTINVVMILEGVPDIQRIRDTVKLQILERLDPKTGKWLYPEIFMNVSYWMSYPFWRQLDPEKVNSEWFLNECVRFYENDEKLESNFYMLENLIKQLCFTPFSKGKPLMEIIILPNYTPHPEKNPGLSPDLKYFCMIFRLHHAIGDAFAVFKLFQNLSTTTPPHQFEYIQAHDYSKQGKLKRRSIFTKLFKNFKLVPKMLYETTQVVFFNIVLTSNVWPKRKAFTVNANSKSTLTHKEKNLKRLHDFITASGKPFSMSDINEIKQIHGVSCTAVLFAAMVGAVRETLYSDQDDEIPSEILLSIPLPLPGHSGQLTNRITLGIMSIPFGEENAVKRLHAISSRIKILKRSTVPASMALIMVTVIGHVPRWLIHLAQNKLSQSLQFLALTNIAGPKNAFDVAGYLLRDACGGSGIPSEKNFPLLCMVSIGGRTRLTLLSDSAVITSDQQAQLLTDNFFNELEALRQDKN